MRTFGIDEPDGCYDDLEMRMLLFFGVQNMAEMHPILWSRLTDRRLKEQHVSKRAVYILSPFIWACWPWLHFQSSIWPSNANFHRELHHRMMTVNWDFVEQAHQLLNRHRYRLWSTWWRPVTSGEKSNGQTECHRFWKSTKISCSVRTVKASEISGVKRNLIN